MPEFDENHESPQGVSETQEAAGEVADKERDRIHQAKEALSADPDTGEDAGEGESKTKSDQAQYQHDKDQSQEEIQTDIARNQREVQAPIDEAHHRGHSAKGTE